MLLALMMATSLASLVELGHSVEAARPVFAAEKVLFGPQLAFATDAAKFKTAVCSRRAGKTVGCGWALLDSALRRPGSISMYLTLDRTDAKTILWEAVKELNVSFDLGGTPNESDLTLKLPNKSLVILAGAGDEKKIKKRRGVPIGIVVIDEAQNFPESLQRLVDDVLVPALMDFDGSLWLTGTPSPVPVGYFYKASTGKGWSHHAWTAFENPWIEKKSGKTARQHLDAELKRRGVTEDDPSIQREWHGRWAYDPNALVFRYDRTRNALGDVPSGEWDTVIGVDLGFDDADAIAVLGFSQGRPEAHLREEWTGTKQTITQLAERLTTLIEKHKPLAVVMDTGGLGKKIAEEIRKRHALPIEAAEKARKFEHIELLNDAMRSGRFFAKPDSRFAQDCMLVEWDREKSKNDKLVISERYHSDICDAVLYAFRKSLHWLHAPEKPGPVYGTPEWAAKEDAEMEEYALEQQEEQERAQKEMDEWL
jgi:hypothetical protein